MNTKYKTATSSAVHRALGRPVGVLPLGPKPVMPAGQRKGASIERRHIKRTPSTGSLSSLNSARSVQSTTCSPASSLRQKGTHREREAERDHDGDEQREDDENLCIGQNIVFVDNNGASRASSSQRHSSRTGQKSLSTEQVLAITQESDPSKVYEVDLHGMELTCLPDLGNFRKLKILDVSGNHIKKIMNLELTKDLRELKLYDNKLSTIEGFQNLKDLTSLQLQHNCIPVLGRGLGSLKKLQNLRLDNNKLSKIDIPELVSCSAITSLDLSNNHLETLVPLSYLSNLEELLASGNALKKIGDLNRCKKLHELDLSQNELFDLAGIANLPNLKILDVSENQLTSMTSVGKLRSLEELNVNANKLSELSSFSSVFPKLQILSVCDNMVSRWKEICALSSLPDFVELFARANPFTMEDGEMPTYHQHVTVALPKLEIIDGTHIKKAIAKSEVAPIMRPMSASTIISVRQVYSQIKSIRNEEASLQKSISERFESIRSLVDSLQTESMQPSISRPTTPSASRCNSRLKIQEALQFAASNFHDEAVNNA